MTAPTGVVVMAYGTPAGPDQIEAYYTHIRRGRPPDAEQLASLRARYEAIGGLSPLAERTEAQRAAIGAALERQTPDGFLTELGHKHSAPFIEDAVGTLARRGVTRIVGLVLAPHYSRASVGAYHARGEDAASGAGITWCPIDRWYDEPAYLDFLAIAVNQARADVAEPTRVVFSAHSLPERALVGDPYPAELAESAGQIARRARVDDYELAWQSAGVTSDPWRGPDVLDVIADLADGEFAGVVVCAQGFVSDHLEVLYDLDIKARRVAREHGLAFARTRSLNEDPTVMAALATRIAVAAGP